MKKYRPKIIKASHIGFCFGVKRAISAAETFLDKNKKAYSFGPIIHNPFMVLELARKGLCVVDDIQKAKNQCLVIRSHGMPPALRAKANRSCSKIIDATCPFVKRSHRIVTRLKRQGYIIAIAGKKEHPEIKALLEVAGKDAVAVWRKTDTRKLDTKNKKLAVVAQTTLSRDRFIEIVNAILKLDYFECRIFDTICNDVLQRQKEAKNIAKTTDIVFVVGGKNSANTSHLVRICRDQGACTYHIERAQELRPCWIKESRSIGIVSGASTPGSIVEEVLEKIKKIIS